MLAGKTVGAPEGAADEGPGPAPLPESGGACSATGALGMAGPLFVAALLTRRRNQGGGGGNRGTAFDFRIVGH